MGTNQTKQTGRPKDNGFTIIEVLLFTSLSALFLLIALLGTGPIQRNTQFTIAMEEVEQITDGVVADIRNGVSNNQGPIPCASGGAAESGANIDCVLVGKLIDFGDPGSSEYVVYDVVGDFVDTETPLADINLRTADTTATSNSYSWGITYRGSLNDGSGYLLNARMLGIYFDTNTQDNTVIVPVAYTSRDRPGIGAINPNANTYGGNLNMSLCFLGGNENRAAKLLFGVESRSLSPEVNFDPADCRGAT